MKKNLIMKTVTKENKKALNLYVKKGKTLKMTGFLCCLERFSKLETVK